MPDSGQLDADLMRTTGLEPDAQHGHAGLMGKRLIIQQGLLRTRRILGNPAYIAGPLILQKEIAEAGPLVSPVRHAQWRDRPCRFPDHGSAPTDGKRPWTFLQKPSHRQPADQAVAQCREKHCPACRIFSLSQAFRPSWRSGSPLSSAMMGIFRGLMTTSR